MQCFKFEVFAEFTHKCIKTMLSDNMYDKKIIYLQNIFYFGLHFIYFFNHIPC